VKYQQVNKGTRLPRQLTLQRCWFISISKPWWGIMN